MPLPINYNTTVVGTDNHLPIYDYTDTWRQWSRNEIYTGAAGLNKYVPKVNDFVIDTDTGTQYKVTALSNLLIPTLTEMNVLLNSFVISQTDQVFGAQDSTYVAYLDKSVTPYVLSVDSNMHVNGSMPSYCKLFLGVDVSVTGVVISRIYNGSGQVIDNKVPLIGVALDSHTNYLVKSVDQCKTMQDMEDGEILTAVVYDITGAVIFKRQLRVVNTTYIRNLNAVQKIVSHVALESIFMSPGDNTIINIPVNLTTRALNFIGVVYYTDGSIVRWAVDGTRFSLFGLSSFSTSITGYKEPVVLAYTLQPNEGSLQSTSANNNKVTASYTLQVVNSNNSYSVKLLVYPVWNSGQSRYTLKWFLTTLDRSIYVDVTSWMQTNPLTVFDGNLYGQVQYLNVSLNLHSVSNAYEAYIHSQRVAVQLLSQPTPDTTNWTVKANAVSNDPFFGMGVYATRISGNVVNLASGQTSQNNWLLAMYEKAAPITDVVLEADYPDCTHFKIRHANSTATAFIPISQWDQNIVVPADTPVYGSLTIEFVSIILSTTNYLTVTSIMVKPE